MEKSARTTEEKIDLILSQVLTIQGQMTILQGQMNTIDERIDKKLDEKLDKRFTEFEEKMDKKLDEKLDKRFAEFEVKIDKKLDEKLDKRFTDFKKELGIFLGGIFQEEENKIEKTEKEVQKLPCVSLKTKLKKFVSKTN